MHKEIGEIPDAELAIADYVKELELGSPGHADPLRWVQEESGHGGYNDIEKEIAGYTVLLKLQPKEAVRLYNTRAYAYELLWEWDKAIADDDAVLKIDPGNVRALEQRVRMNMEKQSTSPQPLPDAVTKELADLTELIRLKPESGSYVRRGEVYERVGDYDKATADYQQALTISKDMDNGAWEGMADIYAANGEWDKAIGSYNHLIDTKDYGNYTNHYTIYNYRASLYLNAGEYDKSIADVNMVMEGARQALEEMRKKHVADVEWLKGYEQNTRGWMATYLVERGEAWLCAGDYKKALTDFDSGIAADAIGTRAPAAKAWMLATCADAKYRDGAKAVELALQACGLGWWQKPGSIDALAAAYAESGDWEKAVAYEKMAMKVAQEGGKMPERDAATKKQQAALIESYRERLALYDQKKTFRGNKELVDWEE